MSRANAPFLLCILTALLALVCGEAYSVESGEVSARTVSDGKPPSEEQPGDESESPDAGGAKDPKLPYGRVFGIVVGIDEYSGNTQKLTGSVNDARAMKHLFRAMRISENDATILPFLNDCATWSAIDRQFRKWQGDGKQTEAEPIPTKKAKCKEVETGPIPTVNDLVIFYFSGHATSQPNLVLFRGGDLTAKELMESLQKIDAKHRIIILNCCHAHEFGNYFEENWEKSSENKTWTLFSATSNGNKPKVLLLMGQENGFYPLALAHGLLGKGPVNGDGFFEPTGLNEYAKEQTKSWLALEPETKDSFEPALYGNKGAIVVGRPIVTLEDTKFLPEKSEKTAFLEMRIEDDGEPLEYTMYRLAKDDTADGAEKISFISEDNKVRCATTPFGIRVKDESAVNLIDYDGKYWTLQFRLPVKDDQYLLQLHNYPYRHNEFLYSPKAGDCIRIAHQRKKSDILDQIAGFAGYLLEEIKKRWNVFA